MAQRPSVFEEEHEHNGNGAAFGRRFPQTSYPSDWADKIVARAIEIELEFAVDRARLAVPVAKMWTIAEARNAKLFDVIRSVTEPQPAPTYTAEQLNQIFIENRDTWLREMPSSSSIEDVVLHPSYQRIIGLGPQVLPLILRDLEARPVFWFWALGAITGHLPDHEAGDFESARRAWLEWGRQNAHI